ncbi:hypothetical protein TNCV_614501 [Trichonephila clavipes]|nr:hypothetical protein TNCV_614501 [Trichonephila clavipes]
MVNYMFRVVQTEFGLPIIETPIFLLPELRSGQGRGYHRISHINDTGAQNYSKVFVDGPCNFEPWLSNEDDTCVCELAPVSPNHNDKRTSELSTDLAYIAPRWVFGGTRLELITRWARFRYLDR